MTIHMLLIGYVIFTRLAELFIARRNTRRLLAVGGYEVGSSHYPLIVLFHVAWIIAVIVLVPTQTPPAIHFLVLFIFTQVMRYWVINSLGTRWTTRIIVLPGSPLVTTGPYRWMHHPNYLVVVSEIALLPLVFGAWEIAMGFSIVNAMLLSYRIRIENNALATP